MSISKPRDLGASPDECALLLAAQRDDRRALEQLVRRYEPLLRPLLARQRLPCRCDRGDLAQEARIGLLAAIRNWQPERGPFRPFAIHCVRAQLAKALDAAHARKHQPLNQALSLDALLHGTTPAAGSLRDPHSPTHNDSGLATRSLVDLGSYADPVAIVLLRERLAGVLAVLAALSARERAALLGMLAGKSYRQLAAERGCTGKAIERAASRARAKLVARTGARDRASPAPASPPDSAGVVAVAA